MSYPQRCVAGFLLAERKQFLADHLAILAVIAFGVRFGQTRAVEALLYVQERLIYPRSIPRVRNERHLKFQYSGERFFVFPRVRVDKVPSIGDLEAVLPQEPLVYLHLAFVTVLPIFIYRFSFLVLTGRFVINDDDLLFGINPNVVDGAGDREAGLLMFRLNTLENFSPGINIFVGERYGIDPVLLHKRMRGAVHSMDVELFFEERIYRAIEGKRKSWRPRRAELVVYIETARAVQKQRYLRARKTEPVSSVIPIRVPFGLVVLTHRGKYITSLYWLLSGIVLLVLD